MLSPESLLASEQHEGGHQCPGHSPTTSFLIDALSFVSACLLPSQLLGLPQLVASHWSTQSSEAEPQAGYPGGSQRCTEAVSGVDRLGEEKYGCTGPEEEIKIFPWPASPRVQALESCSLRVPIPLAHPRGRLAESFLFYFLTQNNVGSDLNRMECPVKKKGGKGPVCPSV